MGSQGLAEVGQVKRDAEWLPAARALERLEDVEPIAQLTGHRRHVAGRPRPAVQDRQGGRAGVAVAAGL